METSKSGTYVGIVYENGDELLRVLSRLSIPELISEKKLHTTIVYAEHQRWIKDIAPVLKGKSVVMNNPRFALLGEDNDTLVIEFENELLDQEHQRILREFNLSHSWPTYKPHITLRYNAKGMNTDRIMMPKLPILRISTEYSEPIIDAWEERDESAT